MIKKFFKKQTEIQNANEIQNTKVKIAVRINGGFGTHLIQANYLKCLCEYIGLDLIEVTVFGHPSQLVNDALFYDQDFVYEYKIRGDFKPKELEFSFDLIIDLRFFCQVMYFDNEKIENQIPNLHDLLQVWLEFQSQEYTRNYIKLEPHCDFNIYMYARLNGMNRFNITDIDGRLEVGREYRYLSTIIQDELDYLKRWNLEETQFITLQRGANTGNYVYESPKLWSAEYYNELILQLKEKYPNIKLIQIGESVEHTAKMENVDLNLLGRTTIDDVKVLLKHAILHIDGECGMVHLRKAVRGGVSVVLFGPTLIEHFGYDDNINLQANPCLIPCASLYNAWQRKCMLYDTPRCMEELSVEFVFDKIEEYLNTKTVCEAEYEPNKLEELMTNKNIHIDKEWYENWLNTREIYDYFYQTIKLGDIKCSYFKETGWEIIFLKEHPAYKYFMGESTSYRDYMVLNELYNPDHVHSVERIELLERKLNGESYDFKNILFVDGKNVLMDGIHRACWLLNEYGEDFELEVLKIYGDWKIL